ncbi:hypothetical protein C8R43DRAFT_951672 [Mycena crocata]|nr:hypothetical protein C8R43DRAFT_951672 [Mycena crocata]
MSRDAVQSSAEGPMNTNFTDLQPFWDWAAIIQQLIRSDVSERALHTRGTLKAVDVLALASGQKATAFWLGFGFGTKAKWVAWVGFWPGLGFHQAKAKICFKIPPKAMAFWLSGQSQPFFWLGFWPGLEFHQAKANGFQAKAVAFRPSQSQNITITEFRRRMI